MKKQGKVAVPIVALDQDQARTYAEENGIGTWFAVTPDKL